MMFEHENGANTLPRGFRFHHMEGRLPKTPEPQDPTEQQQPPSPPRPRLKLRKRNVSSLQAPTEHFLASVAAADVPIPTIEEPQIATTHVSEDCDMPDRDPLSLNTSGHGFLAPHTYNPRFISPPRTPIPTFSMGDEADNDRPDWRMESESPGDQDDERPSSVCSSSTQSSFYTGSRASRPSDDGSCTSPDSEFSDPFGFSSYSKAKGKNAYVEPSANPHGGILNGKIRAKTRRDAPWTPAMDTHLWSTYLLYLQDPKVTPFRIGASAIPPEGVCHRVARQAKKSWKGPVEVARSFSQDFISRMDSADRSGSNTPTGQQPRNYGPWPHSGQATRAHLRDLCKTKDTASVQVHRHLQTRSPTPFSSQLSRSRLRTPEPRAPTTTLADPFTTSDVAMSLTTSTAESMQPNGPLAQLARPEASVAPGPRPPSFRTRGWRKVRGHNLSLDDSRIRQLGSPFVARTYGPSTSNAPSVFDQSRPSAPRTQSETMPTSAPRLRSPLNFDQGRSTNSSQKRRAPNPLGDCHNAHGGIQKPSNFPEQLNANSVGGSQRRLRRTRAFTVGDDLLRNRLPGLFQPLPPGAEPKPLASTSVSSTSTQPNLLPAVSFPEPPRLRSPFMESGPSATFPRRLFSGENEPVRQPAFATMHQTRRPETTFETVEVPPLQARLNFLDSRLAEIRQQRDANSKKMDSKKLEGD